MRRNNQTPARNLRITLDYIGNSSGFIGCTNATIGSNGPNGLSNSETREFSFNLVQSDANCVATPGAELTLPTNSQLRLTIDNEFNSANNGRALFIYPYSSGLGTSRIELPATTVISVDSVSFYDAAHPNGSQINSTPTDTTVFVRASVSDPFGSFDISGAGLTLANPSGTLVVTQALDPANLVSSDSVSKLYEYPHALPPNAPAGNWLATVTADEGSEGTISHTGFGSLDVVTPANLSVLKFINTVADPTGASVPKNIPGATLSYRIEVTNPGPDTADNNSVVISDSLPSEARLLFNTTTLDPVVFTDGAPPSGLTYNFAGLGSATDDIEFSNDGGVTSITPTVDGATGLDLTNPRINHIRLNPKGSFAPTANPPSVQFELQMQLD